MSPLDEVDLIGRLYAEHGGATLAFVRRYVADPDRAEDVVQETFLRVWRRLDKLDPDRDPRAYLFAVARNVIVDLWRADTRRPVSLQSDEELARLPSTDDVERALDGLLVAEALGRLTPQHREVVAHLHYGGRSVADTASLLGIPEGTVKSRSYYAMRALRSAFEEMGVVR